MPPLTTEVTTLADMTVRVGVSLPDSEAATGFGDTAATAETLFEPGGRTSGPATGGPTADGGPLAVGQAFGNRYHIIRALGVGGMGAVYQAFDAELGIAVAIKVIRPEIMADAHAAAEVERRFKRELLLARQVTHTNVVRIHDLGEIHGIKYITMSYVEGTDLATVLKSESRLPIPTVLRIVRQVASGLVAAHGAGVVHRDLKPANIMIAKDGEALIMDFGIAHSTDQAGAGSASVSGMAGIPSNLLRAARYEVTMQGAIVGTVEYMAPEQAKGRTVDQRADVYALGLILYDMLVGGRRAERADGAIEELKARMEQAPTPVKSAVPAIPAALDALVSRCLEPDPDKRFQTSQEMAAALAALDDEGVPIPEPRRFTPRMLAAAVVLVAALVTGTWWLTRTPPPAKKHDPVLVLIADFNNRTNDSTFDHTLEPMLKLALEGAEFINAYDRNRLRTTFGVRPPEKLDEEAARQLASNQGLGIVLSGSIDRQGNGYELAIRAIQTIDGKVVASGKNRASNKEQVLQAATKLATSVRTALGDKTSDSAQLFAMRSVSTTSLDVYRHYAAAIEAQANGKFDEARLSYQKTVEVDPNFALGYQGLATMSRNLGRLEDANKYSNEALKHLEGMTDRERFAVRGTYYMTTGDFQQCANEYGGMIKQFAADPVSHNNRALCLSQLRNLREATDEMREAVKIVPKRLTYRANLAMLAAYSGDFQAVEQEVKLLPEPTDSATLALAFAQLGQDRPQEAIETYTRLGTMSARGASWASSGVAHMAVYEGRYSDAVRAFEQGVTSDLASNNADRAARKLTWLAYVHFLKGQKAAAISAADRALASSKAVPNRFLAARILVEADAIAKARTIAASLSSELPAEPQAYGKIIEGEIALKSGDPRQAVKILTDAGGVLDTWVGHFDLGRAYLELGAWPQADSEFDRCIKRRGEALSFLVDEEATYGYFPAVYYYQGRVREGMKDPRYKDSYREYLKIRGKSTEDPLLPEVRKRAAD